MSSAFAFIFLFSGFHADISGIRRWGELVPVPEHRRSRSGLEVLFQDDEFDRRFGVPVHANFSSVHEKAFLEYDDHTLGIDDNLDRIVALRSCTGACACACACATHCTVRCLSVCSWTTLVAVP